MLFSKIIASIFQLKMLLYIATILAFNFFPPLKTILEIYLGVVVGKIMSIVISGLSVACILQESLSTISKFEQFEILNEEFEQESHKLKSEIETEQKFTVENISFQGMRIHISPNKEITKKIDESNKSIKLLSNNVQAQQVMLKQQNKIIKTQEKLIGNLDKRLKVLEKSPTLSVISLYALFVGIAVAIALAFISKLF